MIDLPGVKEQLLTSKIPISSICLVGSIVLAYKGLRENNDIDIIIDSAYRKKINKKKPFRLNDKIEIVSENWGRRLGLNDDDIIYNSNFHQVVDGLKLVDIDLLILNKQLMGRKKDIEDVKKLVEYRRHYNQKSKSIFKLVKHPKFYLKPLAVFWFLIVFRYLIKDRLLSQLEKSKFIKSYLDNYLPEIFAYQDLPVIISNQFRSRDFNRFDIIVRLLAIENYFGRNDFGWELYNEMQLKRSKGENIGSESRFKELIESIKTKGFDPYSVIRISLNGNLLDGSHRLAYLLYDQPKTVAVNPHLGRRFDNRKMPIYDIKWFIKNGFSQGRINLIEKRLQLLIKSEVKAFFQIIVWSPAISFFHEIVESIKKDYYTIDNEVIELGGRYDEVVRKLYQCDDIEDWKIESKLKAMSGKGTKIGIIRMVIDKPDFRRKDSTNQLISRKVEKLKHKYRNQYKEQIQDYIYDIIMHIGDNFQQSDYMEGVLSECKK